MANFGITTAPAGLAAWACLMAHMGFAARAEAATRAGLAAWACLMTQVGFAPHAEVATRARPDTRKLRASRARHVALVLLASVAFAAAAAPAHGAIHLSRDQALALAFPGARTQAMSWVLTDAEARAIEQRAKVRVRTKLLVATAGFRGDTLAGVAFFDSRTVRTMPGVFMVVVAPDTTVARIDVVAFHEPPDYRPPSRWLSLFARRRLGDGLWAGRDIRNLSGASLSARAVTESARLALATYELVVAPDLARRHSRVR